MRWGYGPGWGGAGCRPRGEGASLPSPWQGEPGVKGPRDRSLKRVEPLFTFPGGLGMERSGRGPGQRGQRGAAAQDKYILMSSLCPLWPRSIGGSLNGRRGAEVTAVECVPERACRGGRREAAGDLSHTARWHPGARPGQRAGFPGGGSPEPRPALCGNQLRFLEQPAGQQPRHLIN